jgi:uncharacterized protein (TIGR02594 family)
MWTRFRRWVKNLFTPKREERPAQQIEPVKLPPYPKEPNEINKKILAVCSELMNKAVQEVPGKENNPLIVEMLRTVSGEDHPDETPWCSAAVGYVLNRVGLTHSASLLARSYLNYGQHITSLPLAKAGDILVFEREGSDWKGHVGFYSGEYTDSHLEVIGGNQSNGFNKRMYPKASLLGIRRAIPVEVNRQHNASFFSKYEFSSLFYSRLTELCYDLADLNPSDIRRYVDGYPSMSIEKRMNFWKHFLSCMAMKESGINPATEFRESFNDSRGKRVISRGLFQLSIESVNGYKRHGYEGINSFSELHDPIVNLEAAVFILKHWIKRDGQIASGTSPWKGGARYWSVLRNNDNHRWIIRQCYEWNRQNK